MLPLYIHNIKITNCFDQNIISQRVAFLDVLSQIKKNVLDKPITLFWNTETELFNTLRQSTKLIEAAGGIVRNTEQQILLIYRNGYWDLPKGKRESGEDLIQTAMREITEETQVTQLLYANDLLTTYHLYYIDDRCILKKTYWYTFDTQNIKPLKPQIEEGIEKVEWVYIQDIVKYEESMFLLIRELIATYRKTFF